MNADKKITLREVAESANVSVTVASRVLSNYGYVSAQKRMKVIKSAEELGYVPNILARSLKTSKSFCIGIVIADITTIFFTLLVRGADDIASENGYHTIICNSDENPLKEKDHLQELVSRNVDGIILCPTGNNISQIKKIMRFGIPLVLVDRKVKEINAISVTIDNHLSAFEGVNHLIKHGYRRIGAIKGLPNIRSIEERSFGYIDAIKAAGIPLDQDLIKYGELNTEISRKATLELLELDNRPDSIIVLSESMIVGTIQAIKEKNLRIPEDIGIVVFDDPAWAPIFDPPLTAIRQPSYSIGTIAVQKLISQLQEAKTKNPPRNEDIILRSELIVRRSCSEME